MKTRKRELLALLSAARHHRVLTLGLPVAFSALARLPSTAGPLALLDRAAPTSPYATFACLALLPRFVLTGGRASATDAASPRTHPVRMPWDDASRPPTEVARAWRTLADARGEATEAGCPLALAEELLLAAQGSLDPALATAPFTCGFVGALGYGAAHLVESLAPDPRPRAPSPDVALLFADAVLFTDDADGRVAQLSIVGRGATMDAATRDADAIEARVRALLLPGPWCEPPAPPHPSATPRVVSRHDAASYARLVERAKEHIVAGDAFQLCLTHQLTVEPPPEHPSALYAALRAENPAPFASFLRIGALALVSSSPERFLRLSSAGIAQARPIKGTRPRGATPAEDERLAQELAASEKDGAENDMIVDLLRNDLARVSVPGSVRVLERRVVERHPTVHQLVSTIESRLHPGLGPFDLLRAAFPGGSMTGAPKVRAVDLLAELEPEERGVYSGAVGYVDVRGTLDVAIVIRSFVLTPGVCAFGVGGGVVFDSDPRAEWLETLDKARALVRALARYFGREVHWEHRP